MLNYRHTALFVFRVANPE